MVATTNLIESYEIIKKGLQAEIETATKAIGENNRLLVDAPEYLKGKIEKRLASLREKRGIRNARLVYITGFIEDLNSLNQYLDSEAIKEKQSNKNELITLSLQECEFIAEEISKNQRREESLSSYATFGVVYNKDYKSLRLDYKRTGDQPSSYPECFGANINLNNE